MIRTARWKNDGAGWKFQSWISSCSTGGRKEVAISSHPVSNNNRSWDIIRRESVPFSPRYARYTLYLIRRSDHPRGGGDFDPCKSNRLRLQEDTYCLKEIGLMEQACRHQTLGILVFPVIYTRVITYAYICAGWYLIRRKVEVRFNDQNVLQTCLMRIGDNDTRS